MASIMYDAFSKQEALNQPYVEMPRCISKYNGHSKQSFSKENKVVKAAEYQHIFTKPKRSVDQKFIIIAKKNNLDYPRLGLAISKKSIKLSVQRNRIKRLVREYFRKEIIAKKCAIDFVVMAKKNIQLNENANLTFSLEKNFIRLIAQLS